jgi:hypothetical protein
MTNLLKYRVFAHGFCRLSATRGKMNGEAQKSYPQAFRLEQRKKVA